jgi:hypothetical protein
LLNSILVRIHSEDVKALSQSSALSHEAITNIIKGKSATNSFIEFIKTENEQRAEISQGTKKYAISLSNKLGRLGIVNFSDLTLENIQRANSELIRKGEKFHATTAAYIALAMSLLKN